MSTKDAALYLSPHFDGDVKRWQERARVGIKYAAGMMYFYPDRPYHVAWFAHYARKSSK